MKAAKKANEDPGKKLIPTGKTRLFKKTKQKIHWKTDKADEAKVDPVADKPKAAPVVNGGERKILKDTIKIEQDKIKEIKSRDLEDWKTKELVAPIQKRLDNRQKELDAFEEERLKQRRTYESTRPTPTFKSGGKMKVVKKC
jgi:hypothetical protein